ncbi:partial ATP-dependent Lon protease, partial [Gammaproteobacteria bacterium]
GLEKAVGLGKTISPEVMLVAAGLDDPARLADLAASNLDLKLDEAQKILETLPGLERLKAVLEILRREIRVLTVQQEISGMARGEIDKSQREYFLRQQLKAIQQELGVTDDVAEEVELYRKKLEGKSLPPEATEEVEKQLKRLERGNPDSAETATIRTFLDWITGLPWSLTSQDNLDLARARAILDEVDKIGADFRGDPSSALLEVLDPEQNRAFRDHYLGVPYDLSKVLFITTANVLDTIQPAFLDRMEVIRLSGYTLEEKLAIARRHLVPKQRKENGLTEKGIAFPDDALRTIIEEYTREAGLRNLEREIGSCCRKVAVRIASGKTKPVKMTPELVRELLGVPKFRNDEALARDEVGAATGLAWTAVGGDVLIVEARALKGKGRLQLTGQLGDVMKESAQAALTLLRSRADELRLPASYFETHDVHVHVPEGAIPKDGPSAGVTMLTAMVSAFTGTPVRRDVAMTGESTLRGEVLPIGGVKEKTLAARRAGIRTILLPAQNERDLAEIPEELRRDLTFVFVERAEQVLENALVRPAARRPGARKAERRKATRRRT